MAAVLRSIRPHDEFAVAVGQRPDAPADAVRLPVVTPDRDVRPFQDVLVDLAGRLRFPAFVKADGAPKFLRAWHNDRHAVALADTELKRLTEYLTFVSLTPDREVIAQDEQGDYLLIEPVEPETLADGDVVADGPTAQVLVSSPAFAPQVAKVLAPQPWLTSTEVAVALAGADGAARAVTRR